MYLFFCIETKRHKIVKPIDYMVRNIRQERELSSTEETIDKFSSQFYFKFRLKSVKFKSKMNEEKSLKKGRYSCYVNDCQ